MSIEPPANPNSWIRVFNPAPQPRVRLVCCPHVGASAAAFAGVSAALPPTVEALAVQYPGRQGNRTEAAIDDITVLAGRICDELGERADAPLAVFGHSMGAAVAFEVARLLERRGTGVTRLFVSGRPSPSAGLDLTLDSDDDLLAELHRLGGTSPKLLEKPAYRRMILAPVRNDYRANVAYRRPAHETLTCPVTFLLSDADPYVGMEQALAWKSHTTGDFRVAEFAGDHFFWTGQPAALVREIMADLARHHA
ncbi:thioesterase II family protein [Streptomyces sp. NPDC053048]|uniref:thioesterase II family protein n=1 Tax=Streptomyces sp. NPDC053048 TaxID=3365694 RepID=UPI0037D18146